MGICWQFWRWLDLFFFFFRFGSGFSGFSFFFCLILYCLDLDLIRSLCFFVVCVFQVIMDRETGRSRGFLFVTFSNEKLMRDAIEGMNCHSLDDGNITGNRGRQWPRRIQPWWRWLWWLRWTLWSRWWLQLWRWRLISDDTNGSEGCEGCGLFGYRWKVKCI